jgi:GNAT superfamily N-acetyltransferase
MGEKEEYSKECTVREVAVGQILELRHRVLRAGLPAEAAHFSGDEAATTKHLAAMIDGRVVGCATILLNEWEGEPAWQLRGMAVEEHYRSQGIGKVLLDAAERIATESGTAIMWCNARVPAVRFYQKHGWAVVSDEFEVPSAGPHVKMIKRLT